MLIASLAAACADSGSMSLEEWEAARLQQAFDRQGRVEAVGLPLLASAAPHCGRHVVTTLGAVFMNYLSFAPWDRQAAQAVFGSDERLQAVSVVPGLAGAAGLRKGDILLRVGSDDAPRGEKAAGEWLELSRRVIESGRPFDITVLRAGQEIALRLQPTLVCGYRLVVWEGKDIYARTTGVEINVTAGLLRFARTNQELALVLSHEIAHNILGHTWVPRIGDLAGTLSITMFDMVAAMIGADAEGALAETSDDDVGPSADLHPIEQELEADYVGLYLVAATGMSVDGAEEIWRRIEEISPDSELTPAYLAAPTHPTHAARFVALREWVAEIKVKQARGVPLVPERHDWRRWLGATSGELSQPPIP